MDKQFVENMVKAQWDVLVAKTEYSKSRAEEHLQKNFVDVLKHSGKADLELCMAQLKKIHTQSLKAINESIYEAEMHGYNRSANQSQQLNDLMTTKKAVEKLMDVTKNLLQKNNNKHLHFGR